MGEEIRLRQKDKSKPLELFSTFHITVLCKELPPPAQPRDVPSTSTPTTSPLSSLEQMGRLQVENQKLKKQLQTIQKQASEKQTQLLEKMKLSLTAKQKI